MPGEVCQYRNFKSIVAGGVWHKITQLKLDHDKLDETKRPLFAAYEYLPDMPPVLNIDGAAFNMYTFFYYLYFL